MNAAIQAHGAPEGSGMPEANAWDRLGEISVPVTVAFGDLDVPFIIERACAPADGLRDAEVRVLPDMAHLPYLEDPGTVAHVVREAMAPGRRPA